MWSFAHLLCQKSGTDGFSLYDAVQQIRATVKLPDHTGRILSETHHANGMTIYKKQVPLGLVAIIYESRPNVTSDAAALTVKSGNVCVLRSGKEAVRTSTAIVKALKQGISAGAATRTS